MASAKAIKSAAQIREAGHLEFTKDSYLLDRKDAQEHAAIIAAYRGPITKAPAGRPWIAGRGWNKGAGWCGRSLWIRPACRS